MPGSKVLAPHAASWPDSRGAARMRRVRGEPRTGAPPQGTAEKRGGGGGEGREPCDGSRARASRLRESGMTWVRESRHRRHSTLRAAVCLRPLARQCGAARCSPSLPEHRNVTAPFLAGRGGGGARPLDSHLSTKGRLQRRVGRRDAKREARCTPRHLCTATRVDQRGGGGGTVQERRRSSQRVWLAGCRLRSRNASP